MKPTTHESRPKEWIPFVNFAMVDAIPKEVNLHEHLFPFEGATGDPKYLWGLYGTTSINHGLFLADTNATKRKKQMLTLQVWYRVDNFERVRSQINQEIAEESGFLHFDRLKTDFREEIRQFVLGQLRKDLTTAQYLKCEARSLDDLIIQYPKYVRSIIEANRKINVVVHPVRQLLDPSSTKPVHVVTVRAVKSRLMAAEVRYLEGKVKVVY